MPSRNTSPSGRIPPVPEAFPRSDTGHEKVVGEEDGDGEVRGLSSSLSSITFEEVSRSEDAIDGGGKSRGMNTETAFLPTKRVFVNTGYLETLAEHYSNRVQPYNTNAGPISMSATTGNLPFVIPPTIQENDTNQIEESSDDTAAKNYRSVNMNESHEAQELAEFTRETLCITWGKKVWDDLAEVTIYPVLDIEHSDKDMIIRVKDLLGPGSPSGEEIAMGDAFRADHAESMGIVDDPTLCAILVTPEILPGTVRVGDLANLKPPTCKMPIGYLELDTSQTKLRCSHVMIVKRGQSAVVTGLPRLRLFVRTAPGTTKEAAKRIASDVWTRRKTVSLWEEPVWHEYFTRNGK